MSRSSSSRLSRIVVLSFLVTSSAALLAQTQAYCSFNVFQLPSNVDQVYGANDFKTVVGKALFSNAPEKGFIRYSSGGVTYYAAPNSAATYFTWRNNNGTSIGTYTTPDASTIAKGFMLSGSTFTPIVHPNAVWGTNLTGINKFNSIVGWYLDANENPHGFRRWSNGQWRILQFDSGATNTIPNGINDSGTIVGIFNNMHGFIFNNEQWAELDWPKPTNGTELRGISNNGLIVGISHDTEQGTSFLYANGKFKIIRVPNSFLTNVTGISTEGLISGMTNLNGNQSGWRGFTATCH
jgi:hypothetical protein